VRKLRQVLVAEGRVHRRLESLDHPQQRERQPTRHQAQVPEPIRQLYAHEKVLHVPLEPPLHLQLKCAARRDVHGGARRVAGIEADLALEDVIREGHRCRCAHLHLHRAAARIFDHIERGRGGGGGMM
jgi:hypothetical protein